MLTSLVVTMIIGSIIVLSYYIGFLIGVDTERTNARQRGIDLAVAEYTRRGDI